MKFEGFLALLNFCLLSVVKPNEGPRLQHDMGGPLSRKRGEGWWPKEFLLMFVDVVRAASAKTEGRTILGRMWKNGNFDSTKGYPGEDGD